MAGASGEGLLRVSRRADQLPGIARLPSPRHGLMAAHATAPQPEGSHDVAADREDRIRLSPAANNPSSVAADALCRHTPKVGAGSVLASHFELDQSQFVRGWCKTYAEECGATMKRGLFKTNVQRWERLCAISQQSVCPHSQAPRAE
jgi:hypothetical protein